MKTEPIDMDIPLLVGYVRLSNGHRTVRVSVDTSAFADCDTYTTSQGKEYVALDIDVHTLKSLLSNERILTTITHTKVIE